MLQGKWLWFGASSYTEQQWAAHCQQARAWGLHGVHPKVADGQNVWYDDATLAAFQRIAEEHDLQCVPYHYCYGPKFGTGQITAEARLQAHIGSLFGAVIPDIEDEYMAQYESAASFGHQVRSFGFRGLWIPTLYANPLDHPVPLLSLNPYMDAWLPQVYFALWTGQDALQAIDYVAPQWKHFDDLARSQQRTSLKPILPIIATENNIPAQQITDFMEYMSPYGYIGFWYSDTYAPYASAIARVNVPTPSPAPVAAPQPKENVHMDKQFSDIWQLNTVDASSETGIAQAIKASFVHGHIAACYPLTAEHDTVDWSGNAIKWQSFSSGIHAEYNPQTHIVRIYDASGKEIA